MHIFGYSFNTLGRYEYIHFFDFTHMNIFAYFFVIKKKIFATSFINENLYIFLLEGNQATLACS